MESFEAFPNITANLPEVTHSQLPERGSVLYDEKRTPLVLLRFNPQNGNATFAFVNKESGKVESRDIQRKEFTNLKPEDAQKLTLREWFSFFKQSTSGQVQFDEHSITDSMLNTKFDLKNARKLLRIAATNNTGHLVNIPLRGDSFVIKGEVFFLIGFDKNIGDGLVARTNKKGGVEQSRVPRNILFPPTKTEPPQGFRYTQRFSTQLARNPEQMGRRFYQAGEKIDGSVIQFCPKGEILVVDFGKDEQLLKFYDQAILEYSSFPEPKEDIAKFFVQKVDRALTVRGLDGDSPVSFIDGLLDGSTQKEIKDNSDYLSKFDNQAQARLRLATSLPPLSDEKVAIGTFLNLGLGVCRQRATIFGACMERAIKEKRAGKWQGVEIRANQLFPFGHVWDQLLDNGLKETSADAMMGYFGPPEMGPWSYTIGYESHTFGKPDIPL